MSATQNRPLGPWWWRDMPPSPEELWPAYLYELARRTYAEMLTRREQFPTWPERSERWRGLTITKIQGWFWDMRNPVALVDLRPDATISLAHLMPPTWSDPMAIRVNLTATDNAIKEELLKWVRGQRESHGVAKRRANQGERRYWKPWSDIEALDTPGARAKQQHV